MSGIITQSFQFNLFVLKAFYLYPPEKQTYLYKIRTLILYVLCVVAVPTISIINLISSEDLNVERANYNAAFLVQATSFITKFLPFVIHGQKIKKCITYFESFKTDKENHQMILNDCIRICRRNTFGFFVCVVGGGISWVSKPFFWKDRSFPIDVWLPFDATTNNFVYFCVYLFVATGPLVSSLITGVTDPLIAGLAYHATTQMKILKHNLRNLGEILQVGSTESNIQKIIYNEIKKCIDHHETILKFVKDYEDCFSWVVFSQISASVFVVCFCCLQLSKVETLDYYVCQLAAYFSVILTEIYFYCYYGFTVSEENDSLAAAVYMTEWYKYDVKNQKALLTVMERSKRPVVVTVGKFVDLSLITFTTILRRSYSLLAVLKNYQ
ncbi:hypothetical protein Zmor_026645 [Zophobas morio]|uniref:Odorant receptor n=1 Tax=Zophobas morio TaxID=2755281 RepID=A0AA38HUP8_9CUCU|nr:hypothetical protein Zmor_026645 [Zophobas morio]